MTKKYTGYTLVEKNLLDAFYGLKIQNATQEEAEEEINWILAGMGSAYGYVTGKLIEQGVLNVLLNESMTRTYYIEINSDDYITEKGMEYCRNKFGKDINIRKLDRPQITPFSSL